MVEAVQELAAGHMQGGDVCTPVLRIKWPNDLYSQGGLKVGGILCQSVYKGGAFLNTIGVGLNVTNSQPTTCVADLIAQRASTNHSSLSSTRAIVSREEVLGRALSHMERQLDILARQGFGPLESLYYKYWMHTGQQVVLEEAGEGGVEHVPLTVRGITTSGYLVATDASQQQYELHPDGNSFDFFKGLVRKKL